MFTGLIRNIAKVKNFNSQNLDLETSFKPKVGDSICVNGACLTATRVFDWGFRVQVARESKNILALENFTDLVHIEPAMRLGDRIEGHILQGHIDCVGKILEIKNYEDGVEFFIGVEKKYMIFISNKSFIAIDGVSLTVNEVFENSFKLTLVGYSFENTLFKTYKVGKRVNIETDLFARYTAHILRFKNALSWSDVDKLMSLY